MKQISVHIRTLAPVVLSAMSNATVMTESHSYFSGSIVRGIVASRYIKMRGLGEQAEEDETSNCVSLQPIRWRMARGRLYCPFLCRRKKMATRSWTL